MHPKAKRFAHVFCPFPLFLHHTGLLCSNRPGKASGCGEYDQEAGGVFGTVSNNAALIQALKEKSESA
jgi:hypothetical protein